MRNSSQPFTKPLSAANLFGSGGKSLMGPGRQGGLILGASRRSSGIESMHSPNRLQRALATVGRRSRYRSFPPPGSHEVILGGEPVLEAADRVHKLFATLLDGAPTRVSIVEGDDRLSSVVATGTGWPIREPSRPMPHITNVPMYSKGRLVGLVEVIAPPDLVERARPVLEAAAQQAAALLELGVRQTASNRALDTLIKERARLQRKLGGLDGVVNLFQDLIDCASPEDGITSLTQFCAHHFGIPIAAWQNRGAGGSFELVSCGGLSAEGRRKLSESMRAIRMDDGASGNRLELLSHFVDISGAGDAQLLDVDDMLVVWGREGSDADETIYSLARYVGSLLAHLSTVERGQLSTERVEEGIALVAHEMKTPVIGATAAIDFAIASGDIDTHRRRLLSTARRDLEKLLDLADSLLCSTADGAGDDLMETDLAELVRRAAESCSREGRDDRITVDAPAELRVRGDVPQLLAALENMIGTALVYTRAKGDVTVRVSDHDGLATVSVQDHGPTTSPDELEAIFEPALRSHKMGSRAGKTLGLVLARRVADALGGRVWAEGRPDGAVIHFQVPSLSAPR